MKRFLILVLAIVLSFYSNAQQNKDSARRENDYQKGLSIRDSLLSDSLFNSYADFRRDPNGKLGLRIKYYNLYHIPYAGLSKERILEFLGKPDAIDSGKYAGDSLETYSFYYKLGSISDSISDEEHKDGVISSGKSYSLRIDFKNNRATQNLFDYVISGWGSNW